MKPLLELLGFCSHQWEVKERIEISHSIYGNVHTIEYVLQCKKCGEIKSTRV